MAKFATILAAAGSSTRFGDARRKKPFVDLDGRAVWLRAAEHFVNRDDVAQTLIAIAPEDREFFKQKFLPNLAFMEIQVVDGGTTRAESVFNALQQVDREIDYVAVHDAARPLLTQSWVSAIFDAAHSSGAAIPAIRVTSTLKRAADFSITETVPRNDLWLAQTPQVFRRELLLEAYSRSKNLTATDEAGMVEGIGHPVAIVEGSPMNIKITTQDDFRMAKGLLNALPKDKGLPPLHPFADEEPGFLV